MMYFRHVRRLGEIAAVEETVEKKANGGVECGCAADVDAFEDGESAAA